MSGKRWIRYEKEISDKIAEEGDITLQYTFVEFLLNTLSEKILVIENRNGTTKIPIKNIIDCGISYDTFWYKLDDGYSMEHKYPQFSIENNE